MTSYQKLKAENARLKENLIELTDFIELIKAYEEYIELLGKENKDLVGIAFVHGWRGNKEYSDKGEELRQRIAELKQTLNL